MHQASSSREVGSTLMVAEFPDWFSITAKPNFERYLIPLAGQQNFRCLQLGVYTGDASVWLMENILTGEDSYLVDVDTWKGSDEEAHESISFSAVFDYYKQRTEHFDIEKHQIVQETTVEYLTTTSFWRSIFNFIYIDADHTTVGVLMDAELSWPLLRSGGIMAFDDYTWGEHLPPHKRPKLGIDLFLERHIWEYEVLEQGLQVWVRKL